MVTAVAVVYGRQFPDLLTTGEHNQNASASAFKYVLYWHMAANGCFHWFSRPPVLCDSKTYIWTCFICFNVSNGFWKLQSHLNICFIICFSNCTVSIITFHYIHILMYQINGFENGSLIWTLLDRSLMMGWSFFSLFGFLTALYLYFSPIHIFMYQMDSENGCLIWFCFFICFSSIIE